MRAHSGTKVFRVLGHKMLAPYLRPSGPDGKRFPTVVFLHGFPGAEKNVDVQRELMKRGIATVSPFFLGAWGSGGSYRFSTLVPQARAALRSIRRLPFVDPRRIAVYGFSMGGWTALNVAAFERELRAVVAVSPAGGPEMIGPHTRPFLTRMSKPLNTPGVDALLGDLCRAMTRFDPARAVTRVRAPLLLIHGDEDETVPVAVSERLARLAARARLVIERGADHAYLDRREKLARRVAGWLAPLLARS